MNDKTSRELMKFLSGVARRLGAAEHIYVVGGAVRNFLIDRPVKDVDVVIDSVALGGKDSAWFAQEVAKAVPVHTNLTTNQYGVAILSIKGDWEVGGENLNGEVIEIATAREESYGKGMGKGHKPSEVAPSTIEKDVFRREFTWNTLMWRLLDLEHGPDQAEVIDLTGCGLKDLEARETRCPRDPDEVFGDDPTRMLRAVKFLAKYDFTIPPDIAEAIRRNAPQIKRMPWEAVATILVDDILKLPGARGYLVTLVDLGLMPAVAEMVQEHQAFASYLSGQLQNREVPFLLDLLDLGINVRTKITFLDPSQQRQLREITTGMSSREADEFVALLKQPPIKQGELFQEFSLEGQGRQRPAYGARLLMLRDPTLALDGARLHREVRALFQSGRLASTWKDKLPGGLADKKKPSDFYPKALAKGTKVEREHTSDDGIAQEVAMDHLTEDPSYYDKLEKIEKHGGSPLVRLKIDVGEDKEVEKVIPSGSLPYLTDGEMTTADVAGLGKQAGGKDPAVTVADPWPEIEKSLSAYHKLYRQVEQWNTLSPERQQKAVGSKEGLALLDAIRRVDPAVSGGALGVWLRTYWGGGVLRHFERPRKIIGETALLAFRLATGSSTVVPLRDALKSLLLWMGKYNEKINEYLAQAGAEHFTYQGFPIENPHRIPDPAVKKMLEGVDYIVSLFERRGVTPLLMQTVKVFRMRGRTEGERRAGILGWHHTTTRMVEWLVDAVTARNPRMLQTWVQEVLLHEVGHALHLDFLHPEAKAEWDSGWAGVGQARESLKDRLYEHGTVRYGDRVRFVDLLKANNWDAYKVGRKLKGLERAKYLAWLHTPSPMGGSPLSSVATQVRLTSFGRDLFEFMKDPVQFTLDRYPPDQYPDNIRTKYRTERSNEIVPDQLGISEDSFGYDHPHLSQKLLDKMRAEDTSIDQAVKALEIPTEYGEKNEREDFAETFVAFMDAPEKLSDKAKFRMQRALSLSGLYGKEVMRLAARPIPVDRSQIQDIVRKILAELPKHLKFRADDMDTSLAWARGYRPDQWGFSPGRYQTNDVMGRLVVVPVKIKSRNENMSYGGPRRWVAGGAVRHLHHGPKDHGYKYEMNVTLDAARSPQDILDNLQAVGKELFSVLIHEVTHLRDVLRAEDPVEETEAGVGDYYNKPTEVRAFMQQVADEVVTEVERMAKAGDGWNLGMWLLEDALLASATWSRIKPHIKGKARKTLLRGVYRALEDALPDIKAQYPDADKFARKVAARWVARQADMSSGELWLEPGFPGGAAQWLRRKARAAEDA